MSGANAGARLRRSLLFASPAPTSAASDSPWLSRAWRTADSVMSKVGGDGSSRGGVALGALVGWLDTDTDAVPDLRADSVV
jgi:hypothetical protein